MVRPDFPRTLAEFQSCFAADDDCRRYLVDCSWPYGYRCPRCGHAAAYELSTRGLLQCRSCRHQVVGDGGYGAASNAGTSVYGFRRRTWWRHFTPGFSAVQLQRQSSVSLGTRRHGRCCRQLRRAMVRRRETASVAPSKWMRPMSAASRRGVAADGRDSISRSSWAAVEVRGRGSGRIRLDVEDLSAASLVPFVESIGGTGEHAAAVCGKDTAPLRKTYDYRPSTVGNPKNRPSLFLGRRAFSNLKTWLTGTHSRGEFDAPAPLRQRVRVPFQSVPRTDGCIPITAGPYDATRTDYPQDVVRGGVNRP